VLADDAERVPQQQIVVAVNRSPERILDRHDPALDFPALDRVENIVE
jgi:hypothetical protein